MSTKKKLLEAAAGNAGGGATYVDDVFSTYLYTGTGAAQGIPNGINLGDFGVGTSTRFDRNVDFLSRSSDLTGNADGKTFTFSCWVFLSPNYDGNARTLYATDSSDNGILIHLSEQRNISVEAWNGGVRTLQASGSTAIGLNVWTHILVSMDMSNSSYRYIYINDVADSVTWSSYNNANIEFTRSTHYVGIWGNGTTRGFYQDMAHFYLDYTYRDLSTESNRRIFIDANGGSTSASSLTALNPIMYLPMTTAYAVGKNAGTGGDFTSNGSPTIVENGTEYVADSGEGGLVWLKNRGVGYSHGLLDTERGGNSVLQSNSTAAALAYAEITSFNSNGFTLGNYSGWFNGASQSLVSWTFRKAPGFFDIVTYTGNGTAGRAINHDLGSVPGFMVVKKLNSTSDWTTYHRSMGATKKAPLNDTDPYSAGSAIWNDTEPTSTQFTVGDNERMNGNGDTYVAYLFAHDAQDFGTDEDESIIKCGSYTGNNSSTTPVTVNLGWEPQFILVKNSQEARDWHIVDNIRGMVVDPSGLASTYLRPNLSNSETNTSGNSSLIPTATGFYALGGGNTFNENREYIYMAIRRPHKPAEEFAATDLYATAPQQAKVAGSLGGFRAGFVTDFALKFEQTGVHSRDISCRLAAKRGMYTNATNAEAALSVATYDFQDGMGDQSLASTNNLRMLLRRAPGFFDVVAYTGDGTSTSFSHNLGVTPELKIIKIRSDAFGWLVGGSVVTGGTRDYQLMLDTTAAQANPNYWGSVDSASAFSVVANNYISNVSGQTYIAYLFATVAGISKVGSYTGTGTTLNVDCGFSAGARFVMIKRTDSTGDWYVWDSYRGIVAGDDPYLLLNSSAAQVTNTDYIDPLASGFTISTGTAALNSSVGTYIFYAIA